MKHKKTITDISGTWTLHNGVEMPYLGLGVYKSLGDEAINAIHWALDAGYRHIDTAAIYKNEKEVGEAIRQSIVKRKDIFLTSKVWNSDQGYDSTIRAFGQSLENLRMEYLDLFLIHWPVEEKFKDTWKALEMLYDEGKIRAIGVSNFLQHQLEDLMSTASVRPMVNQVEFHPRLVQQDLIGFCARHQIQYEAWSPIMRGEVMKFETLQRLSEKYGKSVVQIVLRWDLQKGVVTIPKSVHKERIIANADIFNFEIDDDDMDQIDQLDQHKRTGADPDDFDL